MLDKCILNMLFSQNKCMLLSLLLRHGHYGIWSKQRYVLGVYNKACTNFWPGLAWPNYVK